MERGSGILLGISSLPGRFGIGTLGQCARDFIDLLAQNGQMYWQILPASPTGYGDSPYQAFSAFAGNPYFIDFDDLYNDGLIPGEALEHCEELFGGNDGEVDYYAQFIGKQKILEAAWQFSAERLSEPVAAFAQKHAFWLSDFALFMAVKAENDMCPFWEWPEVLSQRQEDAIKQAEIRLKEQINYHIFVQYLFFCQWEKLHSYATQLGVHIIGDMPIYVAPDSADAWTLGRILDKQGRVAGCPPDYFSETGQLWGNPVYDWDVLKETGYDWWIKRIAHQLTLYDYLRIDHFRAFEAYYAIPEDALTAECGCWCQGPGMDFFDALQQALGNLPLIAEDLGFLTQGVFDLLRETGFPGLKVLHFAFDEDGGSIYLPHRYDKNCIVYTGTHDNDTTVGWYSTLGEGEKRFLAEYLGSVDDASIHWQLIRLAMSSVADVCIIPMQDILGLGSSARMNRPQEAQGYWRWRLKPEELQDTAMQNLKKLTQIYGRNGAY